MILITSLFMFVFSFLVLGIFYSNYYNQIKRKKNIISSLEKKLETARASISDKQVELKSQVAEMEKKLAELEEDVCE